MKKLFPTLLLLFTLLPAVAIAPSYTRSLVFEDQCLDLDSGVVADGCETLCTETSTWDVLAAYNADRSAHGVLLHNPYNPVEIAHLENRTFEQVTESDIGDAPFSAEAVDLSFDTARVILVRTDLGAVYKLGRVSEDGSAITFDYELLSPAP